MMNQRRNKVLNLINSALSNLSHKIESSCANPDSCFDIHDLNIINFQLMKLRECLICDSWDIPKGFRLNAARIVVDRWPFNDVLGIQICEIEYLCERWNLP